MSKYGPFADVVGIALALAATFSTLLARAVGSRNDWTWMSGNQSPATITVPARALAVALMGVTYVMIDKRNYPVFAVIAVACALGTLVAVTYFNRQRLLHVVSISEVGQDGMPLRDARGRTINRAVVIGLESQMTSPAKEDLASARQERGGLPVTTFMSGYGDPLNDPQSLWDRSTLAAAASRLTLALTFVFLFAVMTLFEIAFVVASSRSG